MFADFSPDSEWSNHSHRGWTTLISFAVQAPWAACFCCLCSTPKDCRGLPYSRRCLRLRLRRRPRQHRVPIRLRLHKAT